MSEIQHGTLYAYKVRACRCDDCRTVNARDAKEWRARVGYGRAGNGWTAARTATVPAAAITEHLRALHDSGWRPKEIASEVSYHPQTIYLLLRGRKDRIGRRAAARILALEPLPEPAPDEVVVERLVRGAPRGNATLPERRAAFAANPTDEAGRRLGLNGTRERAA